MADFKTQYDNPIEVTGLKIIEPTPADDRLHIDTEELLQQLFDVPSSVEAINYTNTLYDGMVLLIQNNKKQYIWCESDYGLLVDSYVYPPYATNIAGQDYANRAFNFVLFDNSVKITVIYETATEVGLFIAADLLPYRILKEMSTAMATMKSSASGFTEIEHPDHITFSASGITIILDPKPTVGEQFRITIY
jgi:hypothetical protein